jgi:hypothetical protein
MNFTNQSAESCLKKLRGFSLLLTLALLVASPVFVDRVSNANSSPEFAFASTANSTAIPVLNDIHPNRALQLSQEGCTESAELRVLLSRDLSTIAFPRIPMRVIGGRSGMTIMRCPRPIARQEKALPSFAWKLESPPGSNARLENTTSLNVRFTPDRIGRYVVKLVACPNTCKNRLITGQTSTNKNIVELVEIGPAERELNIDVVGEAQMPPLYLPPHLPSIRPATSPLHYGDPRSHCGEAIGLGIGHSPQWFTTKTWSTATPPYELVEGRVYHTLIARKDHPASHHSNDANAMVEVDPPYRGLLVDDNPEDKGILLPFGGLQVEWERDEWPESFRPVQGDRISALGFHVIDCGHAKYTELHPAIAVAVHRPRPVVLPARVRFQDTDPQTQPTGTNVVVPGIVTDLWASLEGGQALDCENASVHQPVFTTLPGGFQGHRTCVKQPTTAGVTFEFNIFLPPNPADRLKAIGLTLAVRPGLFFDIQDHPEVAALGARRVLPIEVERHLDAPVPFVKVRVALSGLLTGQKFAKRFVAAWVYPDYTSRNFGLRALRVRLDELIVRNDGDGFFKGDGDWRFFAVVPSTARPWTRLIDCNGCVEEKSYAHTSRIFKPGAFDRSGSLTGEVLLFDRQGGSFQLTGFESDLLTSDDTGNVFDIIRSVSSGRTVFSTCNDQTVGGLNDLDPSTSGCAAYTVKYKVLAGRTRVAPRFSPQMNRFAQQLLVRSSEANKFTDILDTELFTLDRTTDDRAKLTVFRRGEMDPWQSALATSRLGQEMRAGDSEPMLKDLRKHVQQSLGPNPSERHRRKIAIELQELKKSVPPALYRKYLCDLETGKPCPATGLQPGDREPLR